MTPRQLKDARHLLRWSQAKLAKELGVHPMTVSKWERGVQPIPNMVRPALCWLVEESAMDQVMVP